SEPEPSKPSINILKYYPEIKEDEDLIIAIGESREFNITVDQKCVVTWMVDGKGEEEKEALEKDGKYFSSFNYTFGDVKNYNITAIAKNETTGNKTLQTWDPIKVVSENFESGNRIWAEDLGLSNKKYTWNSLSYSGFFYDLDTGDFSEELVIKNIDRTIEEGDISYKTSPIPTEFEYGDWGKYDVIGFMAQEYFAGFKEEEQDIVDEDISLISEGVLSKVLLDSDDKSSLSSDSDLVLKEGYSLNIVEVDVNGDKVWVQLEKDGDVVDDQFLSSEDDFVYETDLGDAEDVPIVIIHFGEVFAGQESSAVYVKGVFQISDNYIEIEDGQEFGKMEITSMSEDKIEMKNKEDDIKLGKGDTIKLMGKIELLVADDSVLRFAPVLDMSEAGKYELRGTVYDDKMSNMTLKWDPFNFEGFYYNMDEGLGTESLEILEDKFNGREIEEKGLIYKAVPQEVEFEYKNWGKFQVLGFMAEKFFAGYTENSTFTGNDEVSLLSDNVLSKVLVDNDKERSMYTGSDFVLEEGYSLKIKEVDINGEKVWIQLLKDGDLVDDQFLSSGDTYVYENDIGDAENVPQILAKFGEVFAGAEASAVYVEGVFQISDKYITVEDGDSFREMEVSGVSEAGIEMKNEDDINLKKDDIIDLMGEVKIKVANDNTLRFYPFVEIETEGDGTGRGLKLSVPDDIFVEEEFEIEVTADKKAIEAVTIKLDGKSIGKTDKEGILTYSSSETGKFKLTAEKEGYTSANKNIEIREPKEELSLSVSPETAYEGDTLTIEVVKAIGGEPVEGAEIFVDGDSIGFTDSDGTLTYTTTDSGRLSIKAVKEGFLDKDMTYNVKAFEAIFTYSNLVVPPEVKAGKEAEISITVENTGNAEGETEVELRVNESFVDSQQISLDVGESTRLTFLHAEEVPGIYTVEVGDQTTTYEVTEKSSILLYALVLLILVIAGGAIYLFTKGGMNKEELQEKIEELSGKKDK
ncbi:MAG: S-layer protein domain-containing protein, partial [Methanosarcinaceae archaeon]|nr:S-layer protein domain-containing protein [Methanosarcinaceae archaeon]